MTREERKERHKERKKGWKEGREKNVHKRGIGIGWGG